MRGRLLTCELKHEKQYSLSDPIVSADWQVVTAGCPRLPRVPKVFMSILSAVRAERMTLIDPEWPRGKGNRPSPLCLACLLTI
jgi:hypothetical protein